MECGNIYSAVMSLYTNMCFMELYKAFADKLYESVVNSTVIYYRATCGQITPKLDISVT